MKLKNRGFTIVELVISLLLIGVLAIGIMKAFTEMFKSMNYLNDSISLFYFTRSSMDDLISVRDACFAQDNQYGWTNFVEKYGSGTFVFSNNMMSISSCENMLSGIVDKFGNYEGPIDFSGKKISSNDSKYLYRKIDIKYPDNIFYLHSIKRTFTSTGQDIIDFIFSQNIYNNKSLLLEIPKNIANSDKFELDFDEGKTYDLNGNKDILSHKFSNLGNKNLKYSKIFSYDGVDTGDLDGSKFTIKNTRNNSQITYEFDNNNVLLYSGAYSIKFFSGQSIDQIYYDLCDKINTLEFIDCRFDKLIDKNIYKKFFGVNDIYNSPVSFGSGYSFSVSGATVSLVLGTGSNIDNIYINPSFYFRTNYDKSYNFLNESSDKTGGRGVKIPPKPNPGKSITNFGYPSLLDVKITNYFYNKMEYIDESKIEFSIGDIYRYKK